MRQLLPQHPADCQLVQQPVRGADRQTVSGEHQSIFAT